MSAGPGDPGLVQILIQAGGLGVFFSSIGASIAWIFSRRDKKRREAANEEHRDEAEELEERRFLDERGRRELARLERERDAARAECKACDGRREALLREIMDLREGWLACRQEARRCQDLIRGLYLRPPDAGQPLPDFDPLPDPRRRPDPA